MATFQLFFLSDQAKDLSVPLYYCFLYLLCLLFPLSMTVRTISLTWGLLSLPLPTSRKSCRRLPIFRIEYCQHPFALRIPIYSLDLPQKTLLNKFQNMIYFKVKLR